MRWEINDCPECGDPIWGVIDQVAALVTKDEKGEYDWDGETDLDTQAELFDDEGRQKLMCRGGHVWFTKPIPEPEEE